MDVPPWRKRLLLWSGALVIVGVFAFVGWRNEHRLTQQEAQLANSSAEADQERTKTKAELARLTENVKDQAKAIEELRSATLEAKTKSRLVAIWLAYLRASDTVGRPPTGLEELKPFLESSEVLISPRDGEPFEIAWFTTVSTPGRWLPEKLLAWEQTPDQNNARLAVTNGPFGHPRLVGAPDLKKQMFVALPKAKFYMGGGGGDEGEQTEIREDFEIAIYLVTQREWQAIMGSNPSHFSREGKGKDKVQRISDAELKQFPVENVSLKDALAFVKNLNEKEAGGGYLYRLPTFEEWEFACRGGTTSKEEGAYHYYFAMPTNQISAKQANFDVEYNFRSDDNTYQSPGGKSLYRTTRVGSYEPNKLGLHDIHGNVSQWCTGAPDGHHTVRGGSWASPASRCIAADYDPTHGSEAKSFIGLRLVRVRAK